MDIKITIILETINQVLNNYNQLLCFDTKQNSNTFNDANITYLYDNLPKLISKHPNELQIEEGEKLDNYNLMPFLPGTIQLLLPKESNYFNQTIPNNFNNLYETFIHEFAHLIDNYIYSIVVNVKSDYYSVHLKLIGNEIKKISQLTAIPKNINEYLNCIGYNINVDVNKDINSYKYKGLLYIIDALSNGNLYINYRNNIRNNTAVSYGHGSDFKNKDYYKIAEIFANYISLKILCPDGINYLNKDFPNLVNAIEKTIEDMVFAISKI